MTNLERLREVVAQKKATMVRLADVMAGSERLQQPELHQLYHRAFLAWIFAEQFLSIASDGHEEWKEKKPPA